MQRRHDPTYYWATRWLAPDVRPAVHALYGFVRTADEIVDGPRRPPDPDARRAALDRLEDELHEGLSRKGSSHPVIAALVDAGRRHDLPLGELRTYMCSMRVDCDPVRIASRDELERYMDGSAAAVGRIMAPLLGAAPGEREAFGRLGTAFQLTNFIRDVPEDWRLDRIYLPGVAESDVAGGRATPGFRALVADEVARARALFTDSEGALAAAGPGMRTGMRVARGVYLGVLDRVEAIGFDVLRGRTGLRPWETACAATGAALRRGRAAA
ncbi:MAG: 15-cis-phytoene synthase [Solirubrobacteraceae bacterium]|jgi:phytoene synthase|nr:15-cis-phytoene synthase [Solirubrobacteraceae bacterium]